MIALPNTTGYIVDYETDKISTRTGKALWKTALCTKSKELAEQKRTELEEKGKKVRVLEGIF